MRLGVLIRNELIKTTRRFAFWVTLLAYGGILTIIFGEAFARARRRDDFTFALPDAWPDIMTEVGPLPALFGSVALVMLISSEFTFRTSRQNVIDGLSKEQFFLGKALLYPAVRPTFLRDPVRRRTATTGCRTGARSGESGAGVAGHERADRRESRVGRGLRGLGIPGLPEARSVRRLRPRDRRCATRPEALPPGRSV